MKYILTLAICSFIITAQAQNVGIGTKEPKSKLHVAGDLRVDALSVSKDSGLVIHDRQGLIRSVKLTGSKDDVLRGDGSFSSLNAVAAASVNWLTSGNSGTDPNINFLGTTDDKPLRFRINNTWAGALGGISGIIAFGNYALHNNTTGYNNQAFGTGALASNTTGFHNVSIGGGSLQDNTTGWHNIAVGTGALRTNISGNGNIAIGVTALNENTTGGSNIGIGNGALQFNTTGSDQIAIGYLAMYSNTTGLRNTALGYSALRRNLSGSDNVSTGYNALSSNFNGSSNTAYGASALFNNTLASRNVAIGFEAMYTNTVGASNVAVGSRSLWSNRSGHSIVAVGDSALFANTYGIYNSAVGELSLSRNTTGNNNAATGGWSLLRNISGSNNTGSGYNALATNTSGSGNTAVGSGADVTISSLTNATAIGYNAKVNASNKIRIGNASITKIEGQVPFTTPSDGRYKFNVREDVQGLSFIMRLRPVTYQFDVNRWDGVDVNSTISREMKVSYAKATELRRTGFIAQQVEAAARQTGFDFSGVNRPETNEDRYSLSYESFVVPLVKGMQEQQSVINELQDKIKSQDQMIQTLIERLNKLEGQNKN